jgi:arylsulfatase A-like enzyme
MACARTFQTRSGFIGERKTAEHINRDFLDWLDRQPGGRPLFVFLNYVDAHDPYIVPPGFDRHFGLYPNGDEALRNLQTWHLRVRRPPVPDDLRQMASDAYDDSIAYLDDQLGRLFDALKCRGVLKDTWLVITSDHGEQFGEHGLFLHGNSLYRPLIDVPLVIVPPEGEPPSGLRIKQVVSLRDLPATAVDRLGLANDAPFPGQSLARYWDAFASSAASTRAADPVLSEVSLQGALKGSRIPSTPAARGPMHAIATGDHIYIRLGDGTEELFDTQADPGETRNLVQESSCSRPLERLRAQLRGVLGQ